MDPGSFFYIWNTTYCNHCSFTFSASKHHFPHYTPNTLFSASRWDWQPHCYVGTKYFDCVVQVPRWHRNLWHCAAVHSFTNNLQSIADFLLVRLNLGFVVSENLQLHSSYLPLGVPNGRVTLHASSTFSGAVAGEVKTFWVRRLYFPSTPISWRRGDRVVSARGVSHFQSLYFVFVLLTLFLFCLVCFLYIKNTKKLVTCFTFCILT